MRKPGVLQSMGSQRVEQDWAINTFFHWSGRFLLAKQRHFSLILRQGRQGSPRRAVMYTLSLRWKPISDSVQFSSVMSDSLQTHELQHARPPCPSQTPRVYSNSCPLSQWFIQLSHPLSSPSPPAPQSLPASGSFPTSQLFAWGGQSIGVSAASVLPMNT